MKKSSFDELTFKFCDVSLVAEQFKDLSPFEFEIMPYIQAYEFTHAALLLNNDDIVAAAALIYLAALNEMQVAYFETAHRHRRKGVAEELARNIFSQVAQIPSDVSPSITVNHYTKEGKLYLKKTLERISRETGIEYAFVGDY